MPLPRTIMPLSPTALNARLRSPRAAALVAAAVFLVGMAAFTLRVAAQIGLSAPPEAGDAQDYDLLGLELAAGNGFRLDYENPTWRATQAASHDPNAAAALRFRGTSPTTLRPPLFPAVVGLTYRLVGREFAVVRLMNCAALAVAGAAGAWLVSRRLGPLPGLCYGLLFAVIDHRTRYYGGMFLTEPFASLTTALLALALVTLADGKRKRWAVAAGVLFGLCILTRTMSALWLPVLAPLVWWIAALSRAGWKPRAARTASFLFTAAVVVAPWAARNSLLLGHFSPLGMQGQTQLAAAYSDEAFRLRGIWFNLDEAGFFADLPEHFPSLAYEHVASDRSRAAAVRWVRDNPHKVPPLAALKVLQEWLPRMQWEALILGLFAFGAALWPSRDDRRILLGLLAANAFAIALTWSVGGRFQVPLLPVLHVFAACGLWAALVMITDGLPTVRTWLKGERGA